jgi:exosortase
MISEIPSRVHLGPSPHTVRARLIALLPGVLLGVVCFWTYIPTLHDMADRWSHDPQYSHGYLVPFFALALLWHRRKQLPRTIQGNFWGLVLVAAAVGLRLAGAWVYFHWLEDFSLVVCLFGVSLLLGGWNVLRWSWPALTFLLFMLPLPFQVEKALAYPLQRLATLGSTCTLQLLGFHVLADGNIIRINENIRIGVAEACGGLSMLLAFFALSVAYAIITRRPTSDKIVLVVSAVPIALLANIARITVTGSLYELVGSRAARFFFHDLAGWFMLLLALGLLWAEVQMLSRLFIDPDPAEAP